MTKEFSNTSQLKIIDINLTEEEYEEIYQSELDEILANRIANGDFCGHICHSS